jgi:hypothetical protein
MFEVYELQSRIPHKVRGVVWGLSEGHQPELLYINVVKQLDP